MTLSSLDRTSNSSEDHWIPLSDLMTGLMMMFLVVAIVFMVKVNKEAKRAEAQAAIASAQAAKLKAIAIAYSDILTSNKQMHTKNSSPFERQEK